MVIRMSCAAIAIAAAASPRSWASMKPARMARSSSVRSPATQSARRFGRCSCIVARARWRALFVAATLVSSRAAASAAGQPSTSRAIEGGPLPRRQELHARRGTRARSSRARRPPRRAARRSAGDLVEQRVGVGLQPGHLGERRASSSAGATLRRSMSMQTLVAMRYSQARNSVLPSNAVAAPPRPQERLLHGVLGLVERGEHPVAVHVQLAPVPFGERGEPGSVAGTPPEPAWVVPLRPVMPWPSAVDFLDQPGVAVGVVEREEGCRSSARVRGRGPAAARRR